MFCTGNMEGGGPATLYEASRVADLPHPAERGLVAALPRAPPPGANPASHRVQLAGWWQEPTELSPAQTHASLGLPVRAQTSVASSGFSNFAMVQDGPPCISASEKDSKNPLGPF